MSILGTDGNDTITPGFVSPGVSGGRPGSGTDTVAGGAGADSLDGGSGWLDWLSYRDDTAGVTVDLGAGTARGGHAAGDRFLGFEALEGGSGDDVLASAIGSGLSFNGYVEGGAGRDLLRGQGSRTWQRGGADADTLVGARGDSLEGGAGADSIIGATAAAAAYEASGVAVTIDLSQADSVTGIVLGRGGDAEGDSLVGVANVYGSLLADLLTGDGGPNNLRGRDGDDTLVGGEGNDTLEGGLGRNLHLAGPGDDSLRSRENIDTLYGGEGDDTFAGGGLVFGEAGDDVLLVDGQYLAAQTAHGGSGNDRLIGPGFNDMLDGGEGDDTLAGGGGDDTLLDGPGNDSLSGGEGRDSLVAEDGVDTLDGGPGSDRIESGSGAWLDYRADTIGVTVDLPAFTGRTGLAEGDRYGGLFVGVLGGSGADRLTALDWHTTLMGGAGNDTLSGSTGNAEMFGGPGNDAYLVGNRYDLVVEAAGAGLDRIVTTLGALHLPDQVEQLWVAGVGARRLVGNGQDNTIAGGGGNDTLAGGAGDDVMLGGPGADRMWGGAGDDLFRVDAAGDAVLEAAGGGRDAIYSKLAVLQLPLHVEILYGISGSSSRLSGNGLDNRIRGGAADDALWGGAGADTLEGGGGSDTLAGGIGADLLFGGAGDDLYRAGSDDAVREATGQGQDTVIAVDEPAVVLAANVEVLVLQGGAAAAGTGNAADNILVGQNGTNLLRGLGGRDSLWGGGGADTLVGGAQGDRFRLEAVTDSTPEAADLVADFRFAEGDRVDLSRIDANRLLAGNQAFAWIGAAEFAGGGAAGAGQWRVVATGPGAWRGEGDTDGDGAADVAIDIAAATAALEGWFLL